MYGGAGASLAHDLASEAVSHLALPAVSVTCRRLGVSMASGPQTRAIISGNFSLNLALKFRRYVLPSGTFAFSVVSSRFIKCFGTKSVVDIKFTSLVLTGH